MDFGDHSARSIAIDLGNDGADVPTNFGNNGADVRANVGDSSMRVPRQGWRRFSRCAGCKGQMSDCF